MLQKVTSKDGTVIAYSKLGNGPYVILVLGALNSRKSGAKLAKLLSSHFTVITYDRRGRGDSTDEKPYSTHREVEDLNAIIDDIGEQVYLYSHSSGAAIAIETAIEFPQKIKKLAIYEVPYAIDSAAIASAEEYSRELKEAVNAKKLDEALALFLKYVGVSDKQIEAMKRLPMWKGLKAMAPTLPYDSDLLGEGHAIPKSRIEKLSTPSLIMHGSKSPLFMQEVAQSLSKIIHNAKYLNVEGQDHGVKPEIITPILLDFFK